MSVVEHMVTDFHFTSYALLQFRVCFGIDPGSFLDAGSARLLYRSASL